MNLERAFIIQGPNRSISRSIKNKSGKGCISRDPDSVKSCNSQESSKLFYGMGEWEMEDWVDLLMTQRVSLSFKSTPR
jgi:hypothetical protein